MRPCRTIPSLLAALALCIPASGFMACGGGSTAAPMVCGDADEGETMPNNELAMAPIVPFGRKLRGCVDVMGDRDFYLFNTPAKPAGGYTTFELTNVGTSQIRATFFVAAGEGAMIPITSVAGMPLTGYAAMVPSTTYAIRITHGGDPFVAGHAYELTLKWNEVADGYEANDFKANAKSIGTNSVVKARMFAGYKQDPIPSTVLSTPAPAAYDDWYKVHLKAGGVTVQLADVPGNISMHADLTDAGGKELLCTPSQTCFTGAGTGIDLTADVAAGDHLLRITRQPTPGLEAVGAGAPPESFTKDYLLKVTQ